MTSKVRTHYRLRVYNKADKEVLTMYTEDRQKAYTAHTNWSTRGGYRAELSVIKEMEIKRHDH